MREHKEHLTATLLLALVLAFLIVALFAWLTRDAEGYIGIKAPTDSVDASAALNDSLRTYADPDSIHFYQIFGGSAIDSILWCENPTSRMIKVRSGFYTGKFKAANAANETGDYHILIQAWIQGTTPIASNRYQVADTTLGYDADPAQAIGVAAITPADCDTVKLGGVPISGAKIIVTHSSDQTTPLYWTLTDGDGDYTVYVPTGATYYVRPIYQGTWLADWCEVSK